VVAGFVEQGPGTSFYNAAACFVKGKLAHLHRKVYLPTYGMFDEGRYFSQGDIFRTFAAPSGRTGILICEDFWHISSSWLLAQEGMELLIVLTNSPVKEIAAARAPASQGSWTRLGQVVAQFLTCYVVCVNRAGGEEGWTFTGGSFVTAPGGRLLAEARRLRADRLAVELPPGPLRQARTALPLLRDEKLDLVRRELGRIVASRYREE
jgi:predicted amidohydrolase